MSADESTIGPRPESDRRMGRSVQAVFGLVGGPVAWFGQLCAGFTLTSWPCFPGDQHRLAPLSGFEWTWEATGVVSLAAFAISVAAMLVSRRLLQRARDASPEVRDRFPQAGIGRVRFLALWGTIAGGGFALATAFTGVAFFILPRCAG